MNSPKDENSAQYFNFINTPQYVHIKEKQIQEINYTMLCKINKQF